MFGISEKANVSVALVKMYKGKKGVHHYHDNITEIYFFAKRDGKIVINGFENEINQGECYIIPPKNGHLILANSEMEFECICIPHWEKEHEFILQEKELINITIIQKCTDIGKIADLNDNGEVLIKILQSKEKFETIVDENYVEAYYFSKGNGKIIIDDIENEIHEGESFLIKPKSKIIIAANSKIIYSIAKDKNNLGNDDK